MYYLKKWTNLSLRLSSKGECSHSLSACVKLVYCSPKRTHHGIEDIWRPSHEATIWGATTNGTCWEFGCGCVYLYTCCCDHDQCIRLSSLATEWNQHLLRSCHILYRLFSCTFDLLVSTRRFGAKISTIDFFQCINYDFALCLWKSLHSQCGPRKVDTL